MMNLIVEVFPSRADGSKHGEGELHDAEESDTGGRGDYRSGGGGWADEGHIA